MAPSSTPDHETVYRLLYARRWADLLTFAHQHHRAIAADALLARAFDMVADAFFTALPKEPEPQVLLEKWFLLHTGGFFSLSSSHFEQAIEALVALHRDRPEEACGYARHCPENPACAAILAAYDAPERTVDQTEAATVAQIRPAASTDLTRPLFRSAQETTFFLAAREVFATYLVYPNVALSAFIDFEAVQDRLTTAERRYFFQALVDCVVFDQHDGYRPRFVFELDSPIHDDLARQQRDGYKDRILSAAGCALYRIRTHTSKPDHATFVSLLKSAIEPR